MLLMIMVLVCGACCTARLLVAIFTRQPQQPADPFSIEASACPLHSCQYHGNACAIRMAFDFVRTARTDAGNELFMKKEKIKHK